MADTPAAPPPQSTVDAPSELSPSVMNSFRVTSVVELLATHLKTDPDTSPSRFNNPKYIDLFVSLARGIDYSVSQNEIPSAANKLPGLLNEILRQKMDDHSKAYVMVLMLSVKGACKAQWFSEKESQDLISYADEIGSCFGELRDDNVGPSDAHSAISSIFSRFYPQMKIGQILGFLEVQPAYGAFMDDFQFLKSKSPSAEEKIMLFTARLDNVETSACIATPQNVNILFNGCEVERRTNNFLDPSPQLPTDVTRMVKYGANILQAVGRFSGHYVIAVALISMSSQPDSTFLKDYAPSVNSVSYPDSDIIEGQSRISLKCPISHTRIQVPVKGQSCSHLQCFDYSNYMSMNSSHPLWHCPNCTKPVCFTDLRIDQNIAKVLKEVSADVTHVLISDDGSWKAVMEADTETAPSTTSQDDPQGHETVGSNAVYDLTEDADEVDPKENEDTKPLQHINNQTNVVDPTPVVSNLQSQQVNSSFAEQSNPINVSRTPVAGHNLQGSFQTPPGFVQRWFSTNCISAYGGSSMSFPPAHGSTLPPFPYPMTMQGESSFTQQLPQNALYPVPSWMLFQSQLLHSRFQNPHYTQMALNQMAAATLTNSQMQLLRPQTPMGTPPQPIGTSPVRTPQPAPQATHFVGLNNPQIQLVRPQTPMGSPPQPNGTRPVSTPQPISHHGLSPVTPTPSEQRGNTGQPVRQMRGSITGKSYGDDISRLIIRPTGPARASGPSPVSSPDRDSDSRAPPNLG